MAKSIKIRAKEKGGVTTVKALMTHPMETGGRKDKKTGKKIPAHFIQEVVCKHKGNTVMTAEWSGGVSKNPYISFKFTGGAKGDELELSWSDNKGGSDSMTSAIK
ncbi:MAG: thiosulfate oxidation carrier complex protein SoxZ [gamma proteobacterium symbiont of Ctena orbiculata]|uniref:thiosulfate oxidation carrier complex protein SoxZ n=1 Tax=Candidatus Thiodiazotropha sp. CDECU1 TaxID=3065865 RepID=UPI000D5686D3|nr:thiosulfate oxidation carrier complex protein SoxZ [Candidatus Thiodiazotropha sp. CDECU1]PVV23014.1 MAG: thiosulfate oxidation carrier complex protein SoxZ [gamma proteobacterium symbiont of Ctena orbiculata]PVV26651.1 MAG: thiosulfate oxidation carrier complex protein SoxZ [gamma proteobacterium symbiont of Ctena orbiculata]